MEKQEIYECGKIEESEGHENIDNLIENICAKNINIVKDDINNALKTAAIWTYLLKKIDNLKDNIVNKNAVKRTRQHAVKNKGGTHQQCYQMYWQQGGNAPTM